MKELDEKLFDLDREARRLVYIMRPRQSFVDGGFRCEDLSENEVKELAEHAENILELLKEDYNYGNTL